MKYGFLQQHVGCQPGQAEIAAVGGAGKGRPKARPLHSPEGAMYSQALSNPTPTVDLKATVAVEGLPSEQAALPHPAIPSL